MRRGPRILGTALAIAVAAPPAAYAAAGGVHVPGWMQRMMDDAPPQMQEMMRSPEMQEMMRSPGMRRLMEQPGVMEDMMRTGGMRAMREGASRTARKERTR